MTGRIPDSFIAQVLERTDIVALIGGYVPLRKAGRDSVGLCPFHKEKTPSFTVSPEKQFYHCFGCGASGTAIGFLMKHAGMQFPDAVEELAHRAGMEMLREGGGGHGGGRLREIYALLQRAAEYYRRQLRGEPGKQARDYLRRREIGEQAAQAYGLGYAAPGWDGLLRELGGDEAARRLLVEAGLAKEPKERGSGMYDRFRNRIMFPVYGRRRDRPVGFGARTIGTDEPKYLNSPETAVFRKGRELYGAHMPLRERGPLERVYVVEGYLDVISLAERGVANAVAALGTAVTRSQLESAFLLCRQLVLCFDGDAAGRNAAGRVLETALPLLRPGMELRFLLLPEGEDPDTFVRRVGAARFADLSRTIPLSEFLIGKVREGLALDSREGRARLLDRAAKYLERLGDPFLRRLILQDLAPLVGMDADFLEVQLRARPEAPLRTEAARLPESSLVGNIIALILQRPALALRVAQPESLRRLEVPGADFLADLVQWVCDHPQAACAGILEHWRGSRYEKRLQELAAVTSPIDEEAVLEKELQGALARLRQRHDRQRLRALIAKGPEGLGPEDREELQALQRSCTESPRAGIS